LRKLALTAVVVAFVGACAHKAKAPENKTNDSAVPASTKDQKAPPVEKSKKKAKKATAANTAGADSVKCANGGDQRILEINEKDGGCEIIYTKSGEAKPVASAAHGKQHCQEVSEKIQAKLTDAGFTCQ
jgi:hypothetical protein